MDERIAETLKAMRLTGEAFLRRKDEIGAFGRSLFYQEDAAFAEWVKDFGPGRILELGTGTGHFSVILARALAPAGCMLTIDIGEGDAQKLVPQLANQGVGANKPLQTIKAAVGDSRELSTRDLARQFLEDEGAGPYELIFIDTDHTFPTTRREIDLYWGLLARGGALCFHDIKSVMVGVGGVWLDLIASEPQYFEFVSNDPRTYGIGALIIP